MATSFVSGINHSDFEKSSDLGRRVLTRGPLALKACYTNKRIRVELNNGCSFELPCDQAQGLRGAKAADLKVIEIQAFGLGLYWPKLDVDLHVPSLLKGVLGTKSWMTQIGTVGGSAKSLSKAAASRENGAKGGRPRKLMLPV